MTQRRTARAVCAAGIVVALAGLAWNPPVRAQGGGELARSWCSGCHLFPEPGLLDRETWVGAVLPNMGARLGLPDFRGRPVHPDPEAPPGIYATGPLIGADAWERIVSWYESEAPARLAPPAWQLRTRLELFSLESPAQGERAFPATTAVLIDETSQRLLVGDGFELDLKLFREDLTLAGRVRTGGIVSRIARLPAGGYLATTMGGTIGQTEHLHGLLIGIADDTPRVDRLVRRLHRPVDVVAGDFDDDGARDYVIAEFGTHTGSLALHLGQPDGTLRETVLLDAAGATSVAVDGDDLLVLIAQGDERIARLRDFASGEPTTETIRRFPPAQGSTSMSALDFDGNGTTDLILTAGDNADISPVYKPYHGVYLFLGQPDGTFRQEMFFHLDGAYGAVAEDFDGDGDIDIAAISYFPKIDRGPDQAGFVYLENEGGGFAARYVEGLGTTGRFVAIAAGDIDGDGDRDIALANLAFGPFGPMDVPPALQDRWLDGPRVVLLRNRLR